MEIIDAYEQKPPSGTIVIAFDRFGLSHKASWSQENNCWLLHVIDEYKQSFTHHLPEHIYHYWQRI